ncbi:MAG: P1 family peptidase [Alphaproteobacteria bacterium]|nr:P1 family peptidase [Alphaproteobacteria bacterium]
MIRPGPKSLLTDVPGILVGNAEDRGARSGATVILPDERSVCGVDVRGGAPGTRETDAGDPSCLVDKVDAVVLSGGSTFGLDAAGGVMSWLAKRGRGYPIGPTALVPIIPSAILFDLLNGGDKSWGDEPPYRKLGMTACENAAEWFALGNAGAGLGATVGFAGGDQINGGLGSASFVIEVDGRPAVTVAALAAVNPVGSVLMPGTDVFWAWPFEQGGEFGGRRPRSDQVNPVVDDRFPGEMAGNTTLVAVATDAALTKAEAKRVAIMAHDGIARAIRPVHTPFDGDTVFVLATGAHRLVDPAVDLARIGSLAADCVSRAIARGVYEAGDLDNIPSYRSLYP